MVIHDEIRTVFPAGKEVELELIEGIDDGAKN